MLQPRWFDPIRRRLGSPLAILAAVTLAGAALRFYKLGEWSFWKDEIFTLGTKADGLHISFLGESLVRDAIRWTVALLGQSEWNARLIPALIGIASIPLLFFPIRRLFGVNAALLFCATLAVSPWHIYWSQTARFYVLLMLFAALSLLTLAIAVAEGKPWAGALSLLFMILAVRESLVALFIVPIALGYVAISWLAPRGRPRLNLRVVAPLLALAGVVVAVVSRPYWGDFPAWMAGFGRVNNSPAWLLAATIYYVGVPTACMALFAAWNHIKQRRLDGALLGLWSVLPLATIVGLASFHYTATRYSFLSLPAWLILASLGAIELRAQAGGGMRVLTAGVLVLLVAAPLSDDFLYFNYQNGNRENGRAAYFYIRQRLDPGDLVVSADSEVGDYYMGDRTLPMGLFDPDRLNHYSRAWFVEDLDSADLYPGQMQWIIGHATRVADFDVNAGPRVFKMRVYLYVVEGDDG
jgi:hypothetical protein